MHSHDMSIGLVLTRLTRKRSGSFHTDTTFDEVGGALTTPSVCGNRRGRCRRFC